MHRYAIPSYEQFISTWSRAQVLLAIDAMFWSEPKEKKDYGPMPQDRDLSGIRGSASFVRAMGLGVMEAGGG